MNIEMRQSPEDFSLVAEALKSLAAKTLKVGLPPSKGEGLLFVLAIQEHGSPVNRIPARPVVRPALYSAEVRSEMAEAMLGAVEATWNGDEAGATAGLEAAGKAGADGIRAYIDKGVSPPNSPITVSGGWMRNRVSGKPVHIPGKGASRPLIDSGALYNAFDFEIDEG